jgi:hypothetical protein
MCLYMVKKDYVKNIEKDDVVTRFWYTLKNLHPPFNLIVKLEKLVYSIVIIL